MQIEAEESATRSSSVNTKSIKRIPANQEKIVKQVVILQENGDCSIGPLAIMVQDCRTSTLAEKNIIFPIFSKNFVFVQKKFGTGRRNTNSADHGTAFFVDCDSDSGS